MLLRKLLCAPERKHNGIAIGNVDRPALIDPLPLKEEQHSELYRGMSKANRDQALLDHLESLVKTRHQEDDIPRLLFMTYNQFEPTAAAKAISTDDPITLDVRLYNKLHSTAGGQMALPDLILVEEYAEKGATSSIVKDIAKTIYRNVEALDKDKVADDESRTALLFGPKLEGKRAIQFWIMPQSIQMEKMYMYHEESLAWFLDPDLASEGERLLYVEAHLVPK